MYVVAHRKKRTAVATGQAQLLVWYIDTCSFGHKAGCSAREVSRKLMAHKPQIIFYKYQHENKLMKQWKYGRVQGLEAPPPTWPKQGNATKTHDIIHMYEARVASQANTHVSYLPTERARRSDCSMTWCGDAWTLLNAKQS